MNIRMAVTFSDYIRPRIGLAYLCDFSTGLVSLAFYEIP